MPKAPNLPTITATHLSAAQINSAFDLIENSFQNTLSRDGSTPNAMGADLDLNGHDLLNVALIAADDITIDGTNVSGILERAEIAADEAQTAATASQEAAEFFSGVQAYGALGNGVDPDQAAFTAALAATTGPVYVPWTPSYYVLSSLSEANRRRLYGPGDVWVAGVKTFISSEPYVGDDDGHVRVYNNAWTPSKWSSVDGSLYAGAGGINMTRTGGFGTYGMFLSNLTVTDPTPSPEFDVASTAWVTHKNLTGGSVFGAWVGSAGPSPVFGDTFTSGAVIGSEINIGAREMTNSKVQPDGLKDYVGLKIVPDVIPTTDGPAYEPVSNITIASPGVITRTAHGYYNGLRLRIFANTGTLPGGFTSGSQYFVVNATTNTFQLSATYGGTAINTTGTFAAGVAVLPAYPSHFGLNVNRSIWSHQFWHGIVIGADTIVPGGTSIRVRGGSSAAQAPGNAFVLDGFFSTGINTSVGTYVDNNALFLGSGQNVRWSGNARINSTAGTMGITTGDSDSAGGLYSNGYSTANIVWDGSGGVSKLRFFGAGIPIARPTITGSRGGNAALASLLTQLAALGLVTDSTS